MQVLFSGNSTNVGFLELFSCWKLRISSHQLIRTIMDDECGWLYFTLIIIIYLVVIVLVIILCPIVISESWVLRFYAMHGSYLVCSFCLTILSLILFKIISAARCLRFSRWASLVWIELMGWDLRTWRRLEVLIETKNAVVVANHQSFFDVFPFLPVWNQVSPYLMTFVGSELRNYKILGKGIEKLKGLNFVNRENPREAMQILISDSGRHFKDNEMNKILIFPEGTRNLKIRERGWKFAEFKSGAFRVAKTLNVPVIPVVLSPFYFIDQQRCYFARGKTITSVMDPVYPGEETTEEFREKVKCLMQEEFFRLQDELSEQIAKCNGTIQTQHN